MAPKAELELKQAKNQQKSRQLRNHCFYSVTIKQTYCRNTTLHFVFQTLLGNSRTHLHISQQNVQKSGTKTIKPALNSYRSLKFVRRKFASRIYKNYLFCRRPNANKQLNKRHNKRSSHRK